jgi:hypothetical protein
MRMTNEEIKFLEQELAACKIYLEYGAGGSTKLAAERNNIDSMISVESDPAFIKEQVLTDVSVQQAIGSLRLRFLTVDIGSTVEWGYPLTSDKSYLWPNYTLCPYMHGSHEHDYDCFVGNEVADSLEAGEPDLSVNMPKFEEWLMHALADE